MSLKDELKSLSDNSIDYDKVYEEVIRRCREYAKLGNYSCSIQINEIPNLNKCIDKITSKLSNEGLNAYTNYEDRVDPRNEVYKSLILKIVW